MKVSIVMGSISDKEIGKKVTGILDKFGVEYDVRVISAHRTPYVATDFAEKAEENGIEVIIAIAGKAAHLAGVLAGVSPLPVIGIPAKSSTMDGLDSLLSVVQMPKGVPVATVAIDGGENAGLLAVQILSTKYPDLRQKYKDYKQEMAEEIKRIDAELGGKTLGIKRRNIMGLTYKDAGVDKEAGYKEVQLIKGLIKKTHIPGVLSDIGGFSGLFQLDTSKYKEPVLVSGTDGVGTKLRVAFMMDKHNTIGEDAVAMCANDILCQGAKPLIFLDYIATGKLVPEKMASVVEGVSNGCIKAGCALIGGETAEMPGFYSEDEYDIAGFCVGVVDKSKIITGASIGEGDVILGLPSSGVHSNGYSLVRKIVFEKEKMEVSQFVEDLGTTIGEELLKPTRIYTNPVYDLVENFNIKGLCHITGGGFYENIPRMLPDGFDAHINTKVIDTPLIFNLLQKWGNIQTDEMYGTFNMGVGMVIVIPKENLESVKSFLAEKDEKVYLLGEIRKGNKEVVLCHE